LQGADFAAGATISFGGVPATGSVTSPSSIATISPPHSAGAVDVVVTNPDGQSSTLARAFTYGFDSPTLTSIAPATGSTAGGTAVTLSGRNFVSGAVVRFGSQLATDVALVNASTLRATTPPQPAGSVDVSVANPDGGAALLAGGFQYSMSSPGSSGGGCSSAANVSPFTFLALLVLWRLRQTAPRRARRSSGNSQ